MDVKHKLFVNGKTPYLVDLKIAAISTLGDEITYVVEGETVQLAAMTPERIEALRQVLHHTQLGCPGFEIVRDLLAELGQAASQGGQDAK